MVLVRSIDLVKMMTKYLGSLSNSDEWNSISQSCVKALLSYFQTVSSLPFCGLLAQSLSQLPIETFLHSGQLQSKRIGTVIFLLIR